MSQTTKILLVGCGKMGNALLHGWLTNGYSPANIQVIDPHKPQNLPLGVGYCAEVDAVDFEPDFVILAVKPQLADVVLPQLARFKRAVYVSIMAGKKTLWLSEKLLSMEVVRAMPNLPATIGKGFTAIFAPKQIQPAKLSQIEAIFASCGEVAWLTDEAQLDGLTAISGSGPAYVFLFAQAMVEAGVKLGVSEELAKKAALATIAGAAEMAKKSDLSLEELKISVASKGGTTEAALEILQKNQQFSQLIDVAMQAASKKSQNLA